MQKSRKGGSTAARQLSVDNKKVPECLSVLSEDKKGFGHRASGRKSIPSIRSVLSIPPEDRKLGIGKLGKAKLQGEIAALRSQ